MPEITMYLGEGCSHKPRFDTCGRTSLPATSEAAQTIHVVPDRQYPVSVLWMSTVLRQFCTLYFLRGRVSSNLPNSSPCTRHRVQQGPVLNIRSMCPTYALCYLVQSLRPFLRSAICMSSTHNKHSTVGSSVLTLLLSRRSFGNSLPAS